MGKKLPQDTPTIHKDDRYGLIKRKYELGWRRCRDCKHLGDLVEYQLIFKGKPSKAYHWACKKRRGGVAEYVSSWTKCKSFESDTPTMSEIGLALRSVIRDAIENVTGAPPLDIRE